ncbi:MAG: AraC family transcriptional regulator [Solirubrobacteraceae bacterium]|nr:AraC family transcriptional regulator [Solirubrobacteraceae bacterium]
MPSPSEPPADDAPLVVDRLPDGAGLEVVRFRGASFGDDGSAGARAPHRHDYHEILWTRTGDGEHEIDGEPFAVRAGTLTIIGRGQVHVLRRARDVTGAVIRFGPALVAGGVIGRRDPGWLLGTQGARTVAVPPSQCDHLDGIVATLDAEGSRPPDVHTVELRRHLLSIVLLWTERWYESSRTGRREPDDTDVQLYRAFAGLLERDFAHHHDTGHYADALAVPASVLSRALGTITGRGTKEHIVDRVMLEAERLLRFTDLTVVEVAARVGFGDPLYFSRAFKRRHGLSPVAFRRRERGEG